MAVPDFDTSRNRECHQCHRFGFDDGDWQFVGWDDEAELYICPDCVDLANYCKDDLQTRVDEQRNEVDETGQKSPSCLPTQHSWKEEYYGYKCEACQMFIPYGSEPWLPVDE